MTGQWLGLGLTLLGLTTTRAAAQPAVPLEREPRHRLVWQDGPVRILDVRIPPGDTTLFHIHDAPILYVPVALSPMSTQILGEPWTPPPPRDSSRFRLDATQWDTLYAIRPVTHRVSNAGATLFNLIGVLNRGRQPVASARTDTPLPGTMEKSSGWFRQTRVVLARGDSTEWVRSTRPVVLVQQSAGRTMVDRSLGSPGLLSEAGQWLYLAPDARFRLRSGTEQPTSVVVIEVR